MGVKFGVRLPVGGPLASAEAVRRVATRAEELGYDSLWVHDFISWTRAMDRSHVSCGAIDLVEAETVPLMYEALTSLSYVAALTERISIGTAILCTPYRNPVIQAKQLATIDALSGGRLIVGAGVGALKRIGLDFEVVGVPRADKYERTAEYLRLMREVWEAPFPEFDGQFVNLPSTEINPKPVQRPLPIWFGGKGEKSLAITAGLANGWLPTWLDPHGYQQFVPKLHSAVQQAGRDPAELVIAKECYTAIAATSREAKKFSRPTFDTFTSGFTISTYEGATASALLGSPAQVVDLVGQYIDAGVEHFEMKFVYSSIDHLLEQMELFANEVIGQVGGPRG